MQMFSPEILPSDAFTRDPRALAHDSIVHPATPCRALGRVAGEDDALVCDAGGLTCFGGSDSEWHREVLDRCPSLRDGFEPEWWLRSTHVQNVLAILRGEHAPSLAWDHDEHLVMPDGGTVSVQWVGLDAPPETPVVVVLHTITGSGDDMRRFIASIRAQLGWVVAACNRRGHGGLELTAPLIHTMGPTDDLRVQLAAIEARRPGAPLYGVGVSAGSGLLFRYLGEEGRASRLRAGVTHCPAYDIRDAFFYTHPRYDRFVARRMVDFFLHRNQDVLGSIDGFDHCAESTTIAEFLDRIHPLAGFETRDEFFEAANPMLVAEGVSVPLLVINAADDPLCVERNVHEHLAEMQSLPRMTLALTRYGGHCGFFEALARPDSWADRATGEYLEAVHALLA